MTSHTDLVGESIFGCECKSFEEHVFKLERQLQAGENFWGGFLGLGWWDYGKRYTASLQSLAEVNRWRKMGGKQPERIHPIPMSIAEFNKAVAASMGRS